MKYLAHRGCWTRREERNSPEALLRALDEGYGIETDVRDAQGTLVIAHDPPIAPAPLLSELLEWHRGRGASATLALNIKADGLAGRMKSALAAAGVADYFCFDMSVPEMLVYQREGLTVFTRESEHENAPVLYDRSAGVWVDMFHGDWVPMKRIEEHLAAGKLVALVSPELHGRPHLEFWSRVRASGLAARQELLLCTDVPREARDYFA